MAYRRTGFTRARSLGPIAQVVAAMGGSMSRLFREADLPITLLEQPDLVVPLRDQFRLLEKAARQTGEVHFGAHLGRSAKVAHLGAFGTWVTRAPTLTEAIRRGTCGLSAMLQTSTSLALSWHGTTVEWSVEFHDPACEGRYHNELLALSYMIDTVRCYAGAHWKPDLVMTTAPRRHENAIVERVFEAPVSTGHRVSAIRFPLRRLACGRPLAGEQPEGDAPPDSIPRLPTQEDIPGAIRVMAALSLQEGYPRIDQVASRLCMTRRSLQRAMAEQGTSFSQIVESLMCERAMALLSGSAASVTTIALTLGYADTAHFSRAFRRWTGLSPRRYRALRAGEGCALLA